MPCLLGLNSCLTLKQMMTNRVMISLSYYPPAAIFGMRVRPWPSPSCAAGPYGISGRPPSQPIRPPLTDYRQVVVSAFQQVTDSLGAVEHDAETFQARSPALDAAGQALKLTQSDYQAGMVNYLLMLTADNQYQQARLGYIAAQALRLQDSAALFVALGGGWWKADSQMVGK
jgi:hypothetical protein